MSIENELKSRSGPDLRTNIIAVTKTFPADVIKPLIDHGHLHFGENKVQEALEKWSDLKSANKELKLHMIGKLQTNKVKFVVPLFDYIHSLDNLKLAAKISSEQKKLNNKNNPPKLIVEFFKNQKNIKNINCYSNDGGNWKKSNLKFDKNILIVNFKQPFIPRRGRINCSLNDNGKWRWFGTQFTVRPN